MNSKERAELKWYEKKSGRNFSANKGRDVKPKGGTPFAGGREKAPWKKDTEASFAEEDSFVRYPKPAAGVKKDSLLDASVLPKDCTRILENFYSIVTSSHPLSSKQRSMLPSYIRELSHYLTDDRGARRLGYMNQTTTLSAYVHYYLWWNLVRLTRLFANLPGSYFDLPEEGVCVDVGSGPPTVPLALFLARPELRKKKLTWYCLDVSSQAMAFGEDIFLSAAAACECEPWKIVRIKGSFGSELKQKANLVTCANAFNEIVQDVQMPPDFLAKKYCEKLLSYVDFSDKAARVLVVEPGVPKAARFVSLLRDALFRRKFAPVSPCTHCGECPMDGRKGGKWCNFAFSTDDAPAALRKLSAQSELPKERAVLSFVAVKYDENACAAEDEAEPLDGEIEFRVASDGIRLPGHRTGYYACSPRGLLLVVSDKVLESGSSFSVRLNETDLSVDKKTGALIVSLKGQ